MRDGVIRLLDFPESLITPSLITQFHTLPYHSTNKELPC